MRQAWDINSFEMGEFLRWIQKSLGMGKARCPEEERCLELLRIMLDEQATEEESKYVHKHIGNCYRCYQNYELENTIREAVKSKTHHLKVPQKLVNEITSRINL